MVHGTIDSSLFGALQHEDQGATLAMKLARVFAWDIDFYQDPRKGDQIEILVERSYIETDDGLVFYEFGEILAARYVGARESYDAYLFEDEDGDPAYFNAKGQSLIRDVLRSPLKFQRITSKFTNRRFHPILKKNKPHRGVDYGAPVNTPVMAVAKGKVISAGRNGGAGIAVELQHRGQMVTQYFHLNKIAKGVKRGSAVKQGQVIGYVGQTGYATAPHLHFGMKLRGKYVDPLRQKFEPGLPVPSHRMPDFTALVENLSEQFGVGSMGVEVAERQDSQ
ncbi:MAG: peptidoglycan DD-metalloendopeptidase family protein [Acidobacteria bacterium]|nr:peptidoglycan DD-metalloendopeptidase family protein [Acidobacteriota bacterium]